MPRRTTRSTALARACLTFLLIADWLDRSLADTGANAFFWDPTGMPVSGALPRCSQLTAVITSTNGHLGIPPYYMIAFTPNGVPTTTYLGTDPHNLKWQIIQPNGTDLILVVADANGNSGGVLPNILTVTGAHDSNTTCPTPSPPTDLKVTANVSTTLQTCQPLGLQVTGGTSPYTISIAVPGSSIVTNMTMKATDNFLTYINRAAPGSQLLVSVSDANGWGTSTGLFTTAGSTDVTCNNVPTTTSNSSSSINADGSITTVVVTRSSPISGAGPTSSATLPAQPGFRINRHSHAAVVTGAAVAAGVVAALFSILLYMLCRRRRRQHVLNKRWPTTPTPFTVSANNPDSIPRSMKHVAAIVTTPQRGTPGESSLTDLAAPPPPQSEASPFPRVVQHRDANDDVVELPPPYIDRKNRFRRLAHAGSA